MTNPSDRSDREVVDALQAEFDRLPLPDALSARIGQLPGAGRPASVGPQHAAAQPPRSPRSRRVLSIGLVAAAVAAILVATVIARSGSPAPSADPAPSPAPAPASVAEPATTSMPSPAQSVPGPTTSSASGSSGSVISTVPSQNIPIWLSGFCGRSWPYPAATAPLLIEPVWPNAIRKGGNSIPLIRYRVTNIGAAPIDTSEDYGVMILRGSTVVGFSGHYTLDARFLILRAGESTSGTSSVPINLRACNGQQLPAGTYRFIIAEIIGTSRVAFSAPGEVRVLDR